MQNHAIVEIEEGALSVVIGHRSGASVAVTRSVRVPAPDLGTQALTNLLRTVASETLQGRPQVQVVLGDRRMQHFLVTTPAMAADDVVGFVTREAVRLTGVANPAEVLVAMRFVRRTADRRLLIGATALVRHVWEPLRAAFAASGLEVVALHSVESCLALGAAAEAEPVAMLEGSSGRARFVLCEGGCPVQVRRFLVGTGNETNSGALVAHLAMELPRTLEWLKEIGQARPAVVRLGARLRLQDEDLEGLRAPDLPRIERATSPLVVAEGQMTPGLGASWLLATLCRGVVLPSLLDAPSVTLPFTAGRFVRLAALLAAGLVCSWSGVVDLEAGTQNRQLAALARQDGQRVAAELAQLGAARGGAAARAEDGSLAVALSMRRPVSRLLGQVSNAAEGGIVLDRLDFASADRVVVSGTVGGRSRHQALSDLAVFGRRLRELPYLLADGRDEIAEVAGRPNHYRFRLALQWRQP